MKVNYNRKAYHLEEYEDFAVLYDITYTMGGDFELDGSESLKYVFLKSLYKKWWFTSELPFIVAAVAGIVLFALISVGVVKAEAYWALLLTLPVIVMLVCIFYKFFVKKKKEYLSQYEMLEI
ncbi:MAG: hypothetical protein K6F17_08060 [Lachnospiraceae bacterium]|nr:hypothetical protein [Lachnospiraceae bacterium]